MNIYPEFKKIAGKNAAINRLAGALRDKLDCDGLDFQNAQLIDGCKEHNGHLYQDSCRLDNSGLADEDYYCNQYTGYCAVPFNC